MMDLYAHFRITNKRVESMTADQIRDLLRDEFERMLPELVKLATDRQGGVAPT